MCIININNINNKMLKCVDVYKNIIYKYRTNFLNINIISNILVNVYNKNYLLKNLAKITKDNFHVFKISLFDITLIQIVVNTIIKANLGFNPIIKHTDILVSLSPLTEEDKKKILKLILKKTELYKISIRHIRQFYKHKIDNFYRKKRISKDLQIKWNKELQILTNKYINIIQKLFLSKKNEY